MKAFTVLALLLSVSSYAQTVVTGKTIKRLQIEGAPSFFFKVHSSGKYISYTLPKDPQNPNRAGINHLLNTETGDNSVIPGPWDPVFVGDTGLMVMPISDSQVSYAFYSLNALVKYLDGTWPRGSAADVVGYYQSAGVLEHAANGDSHIRLIAEARTGAHPMQDFVYGADHKTVAPTGAMTLLCPGHQLKLPMLSKDGRFLGALDLATNTTGIFALGLDGSCSKAKDLGIKTGKLNFSYDNKKVTYHIYNRAVIPGDEDHSDSYVAIPDGDFVGDVFVMELETKVVTRVTANKSSNSLYPDFMADGTLVFINHPHDTSDKVSFNFVRLPGGRGPSSIEADATELIKNRCLKCHSAAVSMGGVDLETREGLMEQVVAGDPDRSTLMDVVQAQIMPADGTKLKSGEIALLRQWIKEGAKKVRPLPFYRN